MRRVSPREALELIEREGYVYVDVRTPGEFAEEHPRGAVSIPFAHATESGLVARPSFVDEVAARFERHAPLVLGCATGVRSHEAAQRLLAAGFSRVVDQRAGMVGVRDAFGRVREPGWRDEGLPITRFDEEEKS